MLIPPAAPTPKTNERRATVKIVSAHQTIEPETEVYDVDYWKHAGRTRNWRLGIKLYPLVTTETR